MTMGIDPAYDHTIFLHQSETLEKDNVTTENLKDKDQ